MQDDTNPDDDQDPSHMEPREMDDVELLIFRTQIRLQIARNLGNVSPELTSRYRAFNDEVRRRIRGEWS
jgi:hypothetical protein